MKIKIKLSNVEGELKRVKILHGEESRTKTRAETARLTSALAAATPVDTGYARSRWRLSPDGKDYAVSNDAPYIGRLNHGTSRQAPAHFVEKTALKFGRPHGTIVDKED